MRLLLLLIIAGIAAWYTNPTRESHEEKARVLLEAGAPAAPGDGLTLDDIIGYAKGMLAGEGRYESYYLASKYTVDMPGASFVECYGAYTLVQCRVVAPTRRVEKAPARLYLVAMAQLKSTTTTC